MPRRWLIVIVGAAIGAMILDAGAIAQPTPRDPPKKAAMGSREGALLKSVVMYDDVTRASGGAASGGSAEAVVFDQPNDSGFGWYMKSDDTFGYGTWATQQIFGNGFMPGDSVSAYDTLFFHSTFDDPAIGDATVMTELWDGDPFSIMDTVCTVGGVSAPIPGTQAIFSDIPGGTLVRLRAELPAKVQVDCDRVWTVMTLLEGCRATWRMAGSDGYVWNEPPATGQSNGIWFLYACEQYGVCNTVNGYAAGRCCNDPLEKCDHTDGTFECSIDAGGVPTFCGDGAADYFIADINEPNVFKSYVSTVYAATGTTVGIIIVSVNGPPGNDSDDGVISLTDTEVVLGEGNHNVWVEFRIGDWDPDDTGVKLSSWQLTFDSASYSTGDQGTLTAYVGTLCSGGGYVGNMECAADLGPGALCDPPGYFYPPGSCSFGFVDVTRADLVPGGDPPIITIDLSQPDIRPAGTTIAGHPNDPDPFPAGGLYAGTLTTHVPADSKGCFTMSLKPFPASQLVNGDSQFIPLLGIKSADICVETGRCCFNLECFGEATCDVGCLDVLMTSLTCALMPGVTLFSPAINGKTCDDPCEGSCGDGAVNQFDEECDDGPANSDTEPDACRTDCTLPFCGDGVTDTPEQCDVANDILCPGLCRSDCSCKVCGDDILDPGEACDNGTDNSDSIADACRTDCSLPICGDGVTDIGEQCDGADDETCLGLCDVDCTCSICGNGVREPGEECDGVDLTACPGVCKPDCTCLSPIPTVSQWGLLVLALLLLTGAKVHFFLRTTVEGHKS